MRVSLTRVRTRGVLLLIFGLLSSGACLAPRANAQDAALRFTVQAAAPRPASAEESDVSSRAEAHRTCPCPICTAPNCQSSTDSKSCCHGQTIDWSKYPETIRPMARPGIFPVPPMQGPGYYSVWDQATGQCRPKAPQSGYAPFAINAWPFFDADWRYVESLDPADRTLAEKLKRLHLNDCLLFSTGGEYWTRYENKHNVGLTTAENDFHLQHVRLYGDLWYSDWLRFYGEYIWADSFGESLPPAGPDVDRGDMLDLFVDLNLFEFQGKPVYVRAGRQELIYGSQRLITPLPWANKRHSFDGVKVFRRGEKWDVDAFWTQYVPPNANQFDTADTNLNFAGSWLTYRPQKGESLDLYYLMFDNRRSVTQAGIARAPFQTHTFGARWAGDREGWLWDVEGALQTGQQAGGEIVAGMGTAGLGHVWKDCELKPTAWVYYDYASGDNNPNSGDVHTFNQQFPFGHYYLGWMDLVGRQNIQDLNAHLYLYPTRWMTVWLQYHHFWLAESRDALYNAGGAAYRRDATGAAGNDVGDELDLVLNFHLTRYSDILVSYNKLYGGDFLRATAGGNAVDAEALYLIFQQRW